MSCMEDVRLEKFLDLMVDEMRDKLGDEAEQCPMYRWMQEAVLEVRAQNNCRLKSEFPVPEIDAKRCVRCLRRD